MACQPSPSTPLTTAMSRYASQITRLELRIRRTPPAGAIPGDSAPGRPARAIAGILEAHDLIIRRLGQWTDHQVWSPDTVAALRGPHPAAEHPLGVCQLNGSVALPVVTLRRLTREGSGGGGVRSRRARTSAV
jgi:hypothetical protein